MKVLVAEDDVVSQRILRNYLEKWGYEFVIVDNGATAWDLLQQQDFAIVLSDWLMPQMDGLELIRRIRHREQGGRTVFAILLTAMSQKQSLVDALEGGADDFLTKPFDRDELRVRLRAGERVVRLERTLAELDRQHAGQQPPRPEAGLASPASEAHGIAAQLAALIDEVATGITSAMAQAGAHPEQALGPTLSAAHEQLREARALVEKLCRGAM
jgi:DNA-binding response OmpR family regulator